MASIDERLQAVIESLKLMAHQSEESRARQEELDRRERQHRRALMIAMQAYLEALNGDGEES